MEKGRFFIGDISLYNPHYTINTSNQKLMMEIIISKAPIELNVLNDHPI